MPPAQGKTDYGQERNPGRKIAELGDWRGETLARIRALIRRADADIVEEWK